MIYVINAVTKTIDASSLIMATNMALCWYDSSLHSWLEWLLFILPVKFILCSMKINNLNTLVFFSPMHGFGRFGNNLWLRNSNFHISVFDWMNEWWMHSIIFLYFNKIPILASKCYHLICIRFQICNQFNDSHEWANIRDSNAP